MGGLVLVCIVSISAHALEPSYVVAGNRVEANYKAYVENLSAYYSRLKAKIESLAPDLLKQLSPEPPKAVDPGYQYLPKIAETPVEAAPPKETFTVSKFSWVGTGSWLEGEKKNLADYEKLLESAQRKELEELIPKYQRLDYNQRIINSQIQYNRLWQGEIAGYPGRYNEKTKMYDDLVSKKVSPESVVADTLKQLMAVPTKAIQLKEDSPKRKTIAVDMVSDIADVKYLNQVKKAIEKFWHVRGETEYRVKVQIKPLEIKELYGKDPAPKAGDKIEIGKHIERFPIGPAILTTGAGSLHYSFLNGRPFVVLGTLDLNEVLIAHEFGHLLQLNDAYFRGYRDLGENGYEVLEVVPDMTDIMSAPGVGRVKKHHFDIVIKAIKERGK